MYVCMFAIGARTAGPRELKFGTEVGFHHGSFIGKVWTGRAPPPGRGWPQSASGGPPSPNRAFPRKLYKSKVGEHPQFIIGWSCQNFTQGSGSWS